MIVNIIKYPLSGNSDKDDKHDKHGKDEELKELERTFFLSSEFNFINIINIIIITTKRELINLRDKGNMADIVSSKRRIEGNKLIASSLIMLVYIILIMRHRGYCK